MKKATFAAMFMSQLMATTAWAQANVPDDGTAPTPVGESTPNNAPIVVTAQRREEQLQDVPISISVVDSATIENAGITDMTQLNAIVPGLNIQHTVGSFQPAIRGITTVSNIVENPVALYIDGVYMPNQRDGMRELADVEQIAVLRGPQGTLFGRNATAGVIQITTRRPSYDPEGELMIGIDNYLTARGSLYVTGPLSDNIAVSASVNYSHQGEGWGESLTSGRDTYRLEHSLSLRGKVLIEPTDRTEITIIGDYLDREDSGRDYQPYPGTTYAYPGFGPVTSRYDTYSSTPVYNRFRSRGVSLQIEHEFDFAKLVSISSYRRGTGGFRFDFTGVETPFIISTADLRNRNLTQELQLVSPSGGAFQWVAGVYYIQNEIEYADFPRVVTQPFPPLAIVSRIDGQAREETESIAPFAQVDINITDTTTLTLGARYTFEEREIIGANSLVLTNGLVIPQPAVIPSTLTEEEPTWRIALNQELNPDVSVYASYNRGIKSGGFNIATPQAPAYLTETLDAFEIGLKSELFDRRLTFNTSAFYNRYDNLQVQTFIGGPTPVITNGAQAEIYGIDGDFIFQANDRLTFNGGFQLMHTEFTDYGANCDPATGLNCAPISSPNPAGGAFIVPGNATGNRLPLAQEFTGTLALDYEVPIGSQLLMNFNFTGSYNGSYFFEPDNFMRQPSYWMLNSSLRISNVDETASVTFAISNILDESIITNTGTQAYAYYASYGAAPRLYTLTGRFRF